MNQRPLVRSFAGGEITPELFGRIDLTKNQTGLETALNFEILPHGPAQNRAGFQYVLEVKDSTRPAKLIPFAYSATQTFAIVMNAGKFRFHTEGGTLIETGKNITTITQASPGQITAIGHGYSTGDEVFLASIGGMTELNGRFVKITKIDPDNYTVADLAGTGIDTTGYDAYTAGGTSSRVYEVTMPYTDDELFDVHWTQSADVLTLVHPAHAPAELRRLGATNWTYAAILFVPTVDPPAPTVVNTGAGTDIDRYKVTSITQTGLEESIASNPAVSTNSTIEDVTQADPGVIKSSGHGLAVDDPIFIDEVEGMVELNGNEYLVATVPDADHITIKDLTGEVIDTTGFTAYTANGKIYFAGIENDLTVDGQYNTISWAKVTGAIRYNVYKFMNGLYGYIGQTAGVTFKDDNIAPDISTTPPLLNNPYVSDYPGAVGYFEQRRVFAGTPLHPQSCSLTRSATESNLGYSIPTRDDDSISFTITSRDANTIRHIVPLSKLIMLTSGGEWALVAQNSDILTPASVKPEQQDATGANNVQPIVAGRSLIYAQAVGGRLREMTYQWQAQGFPSNDLCVMCPHLFDDYTMVDMAFTKAPYRMAWVVRDDGVLIGLTYLPEQQVVGFHHHDTDGLFESVCAVAEGAETALYAIVQRTINGRSVRHVERKASRRFSTLADAFFVDAGVTYSGAPATVISGLWHLIGETVSVLADGAVWRDLTVGADGKITLPVAASKVHIGLPYDADLKTVPLAYEALPGGGSGIKQNINKTYLRLFKSSGVFAGPSFDRLTLLKQRTTEPYGSPPNLLTGIYPLVIKPEWGLEAALCIRQSDPLPVTLSSLTVEVGIGG